MYLYYFVQGGANNEGVIKVYEPRSTTPDKRPIVLYLLSTELEEPPFDHFCGGEIVCLPQTTNSGTPWKNDVPNWLRDWVALVQRYHPFVPWSLFGCSRGAAWGLLMLAAEPKLEFVSL